MKKAFKKRLQHPEIRVDELPYISRIGQQDVELPFESESEEAKESKEKPLFEVIQKSMKCIFGCGFETKDYQKYVYHVDTRK